MPVFEDFYFPSTTGHNTVRALKCTPEGEVKAVVQISHGIAEHMDRYRDFMVFLAENGYLAVGNDHLGHGKTITEPGQQGFFAEKDGWNLVVEDMDRLRERMRKEYPAVPYVLFGHSMGSFLTRTYLIQHPDSYDAAILSGTGHQSRLMVLGACAAAKLIKRKEGARTVGNTLSGIAFGSYNRRIENPRTVYDWISCDGAVADAYAADPLCGFVSTNALFCDMLDGIRFITDPKNIRLMNREKPVYFMSGAEDPVGEYGKGVNRAYEAFCDAGLHDVMLRLYPGGRHEMLNEINKDQVFQDILDWLNEKLV